MAFGTSPHGLGIEPHVFWALSLEELHAFKRPWAAAQAQFHNAHFQTNGVPWIADDFMVPGSREGRVQRQKHDEADLLKMTQQLQWMKPGDTTDIPEWAFGRKGRPKNGRQQ